MFFTGGQLVFTGRQNFLNWTSLWEKLSSKWSNQASKILLTTGQFAWCPALNEIPGKHLTRVQGTCTMNGVSNILHMMTRKECLPWLLQACCWPSFQVAPSGENQVYVKHCLFKISAICKLVIQASMQWHHEKVFYFKYIYLLLSHFPIGHSRTT